MSFRSILDIFREDNWSNNLVEKITEMLDLGSAMFEYTAGVVIEGEPDSDSQVKLYDRDKRINKLERKIRRRVVTRLSVSGNEADIPSALIFTNVVKDAERIGDYIKNLHEVGEMMPENPDRALYRDRLAEPAEEIAAIFDQCRQAFVESDEETAGRVIKRAKALGREFEDMIREITTSQLGTQDAVCLVLVLRFFKRLVAHASNIATTVVMPIDLIDFYDEPDS